MGSRFTAGLGATLAVVIAATSAGAQEDRAPTPITPQILRIARTTLDFGAPTGGVSKKSGLADEGGKTTTLATVGPISIVGMCKHQTNGDGKAPGQAFSAAGFDFDQDGDEAKILVYTSTGTLSFQGLNGPRKNIAAGKGTPSTSNPGSGGAGDPTGTGEGKHQILAVARDPDQAKPKNDWEAAFKAVGGYIAASGGVEVVLNAYAAIDSLGIGDKCGFGGVVTVINPP